MYFELYRLQRDIINVLLGRLKLCKKVVWNKDLRSFKYLGVLIQAEKRLFGQVPAVSVL